MKFTVRKSLPDCSIELFDVSAAALIIATSWQLTRVNIHAGIATIVGSLLMLFAPLIMRLLSLAAIQHCVTPIATAFNVRTSAELRATLVEPPRLVGFQFQTALQVGGARASSRMAYSSSGV